MTQDNGLHRRLFLSAAAFIAAQSAFAQQAAPKPVTAPDPQAPVKLMYNPRMKPEQLPFSRQLKALDAAATKKSLELDQPVSGQDFDPTTGSQDADDDYRKTLRYKTVSQDAQKAVVEASLRVIKTEKPITITYELVFEGNAWRINDIARLIPGDDGWRLSTLLIKGAKGE